MNFQSGETLKNITITILDDSYIEETEYFILKIESMEGDVTFSISEAVVAIQDDDGNLKTSSSIFKLLLNIMLAIHMYITV